MKEKRIGTVNSGSMASVTGPTFVAATAESTTSRSRRFNWRHYLLTAASIAAGLAGGSDLIQQGKIIVSYIKEAVDLTIANPTIGSFHRFAVLATPEQYFLSILYGVPVIAFYSFVIVYGIIEIIRSTKETEEKEYEAEKARIIEVTDRKCGLIK